jgi:hypothetical protein
MKGFRGDGTICEAIDECRGNPCAENAKCTTTGPGKYQCKCPRGYSGDGKSACTPIDPCKAPNFPCDPNAICEMTTPGQFRCTCSSGFVGDGKMCQQTETIVKWVDGALGQRVPIVIPPPAKPALKLDKGADAARSFEAAKAAAIASGAAGQPMVGSIAVDAAGKLMPAGAAGANPTTGVRGTPANRFDLKGAVSDVLKVITNKLDDADLAVSMKKQKRQDKAIGAVNGRLSKLERSTKDLISTTEKQTATLQTMLGYQEFEQPKATAPAANTITPAAPTAQADIAHLIRKAVKGQSYNDKDK